MTADPRRQAAFAAGLAAEARVARGFAAHGFAVLGERVRTPAGEIDLVVADARTLVFVEVKRRRHIADAAYAVTPRQQARIVRAAAVWLAENPDAARPDTRFDAVLLAPTGETRHIVSAFSADGVDVF